MSATVSAGGREVEVSSPDKPLFPADGITKLDLARYYEQASEAMLPHLRGRPVTMHRFPDGIDGEGFVQKQVSDHFPDWIGRVEVERERGGSVTHAVCDDAATLVYLANQACVTPHVWPARADRLDRPDRIVFDLDPPDGGFDAATAAASSLRELLEELGLVPFVMTTGSRGLHLHVPLERRTGFDEVRAFARDVAGLLARRSSKELTVEQRKAKRGSRLFLDTMRNAYGQHGVAPYAVRPHAGAPVAMPLEWEELSDRRLEPRRHDLRSALRRIARKGDAWQGIGRCARRLAAPRRALDSLLEADAG